MTALLRRLIALLMFAALLSACEKAPDFKNLDITGNKQFVGDFSFPDTSGKTRSLADFKGKAKAVVLFFGYTHCPDVCPTTLAELSQAMQQLGDKSKDVQVLMVTVDPARDTAPILGQYVQAFNPVFIGLRPDSDAQLAKVAKDLHVVYEKAPGTSKDDYTMNHTAASFVFDKDGKLRLYARDGQGVEPWVHDLKILVD